MYKTKNECTNPYTCTIYYLYYLLLVGFWKWDLIDPKDYSEMVSALKVDLKDAPDPAWQFHGPLYESNSWTGRCSFIFQRSRKIYSNTKSVWNSLISSTFGFPIDQTIWTMSNARNSEIVRFIASNLVWSPKNYAFFCICLHLYFILLSSKCAFQICCHSLSFHERKYLQSSQNFLK